MYDCGATSSDRNVVVLNDIHIDIMDYIVPASCNETEFRQMWAEFEWENKVAVNTPLTDLHEYLASLLKVRKRISSQVGNSSKTRKFICYCFRAPT